MLGSRGRAAKSVSRQGGSLFFAIKGLVIGSFSHEDERSTRLVLF